MLEDDAERLAQLTAVFRSVAPQMLMRVWRDANTMIDDIGPLLASASLISLDHDLISEPGERDLGDGYAVVKFLVSQPIVVPVIIHTSNGERARWMAGEFDLAGWPYRRVPPFGDDWITSHWRDTVRALLTSAA